MSGDPATSSEAREDVASTLGSSPKGSGWRADTDRMTFIPCVTGDVTHALTAEGHDASEDGTGRGHPIVPDRAKAVTTGQRYDYETEDFVPVLMRNREGKPGGGKGPLLSEEQSLTLATGNDQILFAPMAFDARQSDVIQYGERSGPLDTCGSTIGIHDGYAVRRLTPVECERLQGFPDGWTDIDEASDSARYRQLGNAVSVPVVQFILHQIVAAEQAQEVAA